MLVYFAFAQYEAGDENILIDSSLLTTPVGNPNLLLKELKIFPNPVNSFLQFQNPGQHEQTRLSVWDMTGRKMMEADITHQVFVNIPTHRWANGVYRVYLHAKETVYSAKIVVQH